jgi:hypothetical protein
MGQAIGDILPLAIGVAVSPLPISAVILMLFGPRARSTGPAFAVGWVLTLFVVGAVVLALADTSDVSSDQGASDAVFAIKLALGLLLLGLGVRQWFSRPKEGEEPEVPGWMNAIDEFTALRAFGLAVLLAGVNPKNLGLTLAAGSTIAQAGLTSAEQWIVLAVFVVLASLTVALPVVYYFAAGDSATRTLTSLKGWLISNNATVMSVLLLLIGVVLIGDGIGGLTS